MINFLAVALVVSALVLFIAYIAGAFAILFIAVFFLLGLFKLKQVFTPKKKKEVYKAKELTCEAVEHVSSDCMYCKRCNLAWPKDTFNPPACKQAV